MTRTLSLLGHLTGREFHIRYRGALLGWLWAVVPPAARIAVLGVVFTQVLRVGGEDYLALLAVGVLGWAWFSAGIANVTRSATDRVELIAQPGLPRPVVPLVSVLTDALDYVVALPVLVLLVVVVTGGVPATALLLPLALLLQGALVLGLGMAASVADVRWRDSRHAVDLVLAVGFYATPVFYTVSSVPERWRWLVEANPAARLLELQRGLLVDGTLPTAPSLIVTAAICLGALAVGWSLYARASPTFADHL